MVVVHFAHLPSSSPIDLMIIQFIDGSIRCGIPSGDTLIPGDGIRYVEQGGENIGQDNGFAGPLGRIPRTEMHREDDGYVAFEGEGHHDVDAGTESPIDESQHKVTLVDLVETVLVDGHAVFG